MTETRDKLQSARESLSGILGRRRPTTEKELDECVQILEELRRAYATLGGSTPTPRVADCLAVIGAGFDEVISRLKNRIKC